MIKLLTLKRRAREADKSFLPVDSPAVLLITLFVFKFEDRNFARGIFFLTAFPPRELLL